MVGLTAGSIQSSCGQRSTVVEQLNPHKIRCIYSALDAFSGKGRREIKALSLINPCSVFAGSTMFQLNCFQHLQSTAITISRVLTHLCSIHTDKLNVSVSVFQHWGYRCGTILGFVLLSIENKCCFLNMQATRNPCSLKFTSLMK